MIILGEEEKAFFKCFRIDPGKCMIKNKSLNILFKNSKSVELFYIGLSFDTHHFSLF